MRADLIRGSFSLLATVVLMGMAQEWIGWAFQEHRWWKVGPGLALTAGALYESHKVWYRAERLLGL
jgi:hypothetical protein